MPNHDFPRFGGPVWSTDFDPDELCFESFHQGLMLARALQTRRNLPLEADRTVAMLLLDDDGFIVDLFLVDHPVHQVDQVVRIVLDAPHVGVAAVAVYTLDHDEPDHVAEADLACFRDWRGAGDQGGIEVLDWFRVGPHRIRSMATTVGELGAW